MLVCLASLKGAPGVTTSALALAGVWSAGEGRRKLLIEADPDGGSIALRYEIGREPGLLGLAAAAQHGLGRNELWNFAQPLPGGLPVVVSPERPESAAAAIRSCATTIGPWLREIRDVDVIADVGRLGVASAALPLARAADLVLMVVRPVREQIQPAAARLNTLAQGGCRVAWLLIGDQPYSRRDIEEAHRIPVAGVLADDPRGVAVLEGRSRRKLERAALCRSARELADALVRTRDSVDPSAPAQEQAVSDPPSYPGAAYAAPGESDGRRIGGMAR